MSDPTSNPEPITTRDIATVAARNPEIALLLAEMEHGTRKLRGQLGELDEDALTWQPYPNAHSIGAILIHIAGCEAGWLHEVAAGIALEEDPEAKLMGGQPIDQFAEIWPTPPRKPLAWYYEQHDAIRKQTIELLSKMEDSTQQRPITWSPNNHVSIRWMLHHVTEHEAYHMGQAVLLSLIRNKI
jgi:uncharacterized damage-inducible protein DinB